MFKTRMLQTRFQFWVQCSFNQNKRFKAALDENKIPYSYCCGIKRFSVRISDKDRVLKLLRKLCI